MDHVDRNYILDAKHDIIPWNEEHSNAYWYELMDTLRTDGEHDPFKEEINEELKDTIWEQRPVLPVTNGEYWCVWRRDNTRGCQYYDRNMWDQERFIADSWVYKTCCTTFGPNVGGQKCQSNNHALEPCEVYGKSNAIDIEWSRLNFEYNEIKFMWFLLMVSNFAQILSKCLEEDPENITPLHYDVAGLLAIPWFIQYIYARTGGIGVFVAIIV